MTRLALLSTRHSLTIKVFHATLALAIAKQFTSAQFIQVPRAGRVANTAFGVHEWAGDVSLSLAMTLWADVARHWQMIRSRHFPERKDDNAFASAVHGLRVLLMASMAASATVFVVAGQIEFQDLPAVNLKMDVHGFGGNLVWAYLIGHAGLAVLNHFSNNQSLRTLWSFRRNSSTGV